MYLGEATSLPGVRVTTRNVGGVAFICPHCGNNYVWEQAVDYPLQVVQAATAEAIEDKRTTVRLHSSRAYRKTHRWMKGNKQAE